MFAFVLAAALAVGGCHRDAPQPKAKLPQNVVPEKPSALAEVRVFNGDRSADVPPNRFGSLAPLLTGRVFAPPTALSDYGLEATTVHLDYRRVSGGTTVVHVGSPTFDFHGFYVQRDGDGRVFVVPGDQLRPALELVGLTYPPPR